MKSSEVPRKRSEIQRYRKPDVIPKIFCLLDIPSVWRYAPHGNFASDEALPQYMRRQSLTDEDNQRGRKRKNQHEDPAAQEGDPLGEDELPFSLGANEIDDEDEDEDLAAVNSAATLERTRNSTSRNTLEGTKMLNKRELAEISKDLSLSHAAEKSALQQSHFSHFPRWLLALKQGFSLLLYGYGSKKRLMESFAHLMLRDGPVMVVDGFHPSCNARSIVHMICERVIRRKSEISPLSQKADVLQNLRDELKEQHAPKQIYLVVNNIDGETLRTSRSQQLLSQLATIPAIHLIASIDHINAPLLWDSVTAGRFNWLYYDVTSYAPLSHETIFVPPILNQSIDSLSAEAVLSVLDNVVPHQREMWLMIANEQSKENYSVRMPKGVLMENFFNACRNQLLVQTDMELRNALKEFFDHKILRRKRLGKEMKERLYIPTQHSVLQQVLDTIRIREEEAKNAPENNNNINAPNISSSTNRNADVVTFTPLK